MRTNMFKCFAASNVLNSIMASSYVDNDKVIQEDSKQKKKRFNCTLREDKRHRKTCAEGNLIY